MVFVIIITMGAEDDHASDGSDGDDDDDDDDNDDVDDNDDPDLPNNGHGVDGELLLAAVFFIVS